MYKPFLLCLTLATTFIFAVWKLLCSGKLRTPRLLACGQSKSKKLWELSNMDVECAKRQICFGKWFGSIYWNNIGIIVARSHVHQPSDGFIHIPVLRPLPPSFPYDNSGLVVDTLPPPSSVPPISCLRQLASAIRGMLITGNLGGKDNLASSFQWAH